MSLFWLLICSSIAYFVWYKIIAIYLEQIRLKKAGVFIVPNGVPLLGHLLHLKEATENLHLDDSGAPNPIASMLEKCRRECF